MKTTTLAACLLFATHLIYGQETIPASGVYFLKVNQIKII